MSNIIATFGPSFGFGNPEYNLTNVIDVLPSQVLSGAVVIRKTNQFSSSATTLVLNVDYFVNETEGTVLLNAPVTFGEQVIIERVTPRDSFLDTFDDSGFAPAVAAKNRDLQLLHIIEELEAKVESLESRIEQLEP